MNHRIVIALFVVFVAAAALPVLFAQLPDYHVQLFGDEVGIRDNVERIITDHHGFVWLMYDDRVQRFDGIGVREFVFDDRLADIVCDRDNRMWLLSRDYVYRFVNNKAGFRTVPFDVHAGGTPCRFVQQEGEPLWLLTHMGMYSWQEQDNAFVRKTDAWLKDWRDVSSRRFRTPHLGNAFFFHRGNRVHRLIMDSGRQDSLRVPSVQIIVPVSTDIAIISDWRAQSFVYDFAKQTVKPLYPQQSNNPGDQHFITVHAAVIQDSIVILATSSGLMRYSPLRNEIRPLLLYHDGRKLTMEDHVHDIHMDRSGRIWSCIGSQLILFSPERPGLGKISNFSGNNSIGHGDQVRCIAPDPGGNLWIATRKGFTYWNIDQNKFTSYYAQHDAADQFNIPSVRSLLHDGQYLFVGQSNYGLWLFDPVKNTYRRPDYLPGEEGLQTRKRLERDYLDHMILLHNGKVFIASRDGTYVVDSYQVRNVQVQEKHVNYNFAFEDAQYRIWIGANRGLYCLDSNFVLQYGIDSMLDNKPMLSFIQLNDHTFLAGGKGVSKIELRDNIPHITRPYPFFDQMAVRMLFTSAPDDLWLATDEGLFRIQPATGHIRHFDKADNVLGDDFTSNSFYKNKHDMYFIGGANGINYFNPNELREDNQPIQVVITGFRVNDDDSLYYDKAALQKLQHNQSNLTIDFVAPYYGNPERVHYRYRLAGQDTTWKPTGHNRTLHFASLSPGTYQFEVAASVDGQSWVSSDDRIDFVIQPPWYMRWWFITTAAMVILGAGYWTYKRRINAIETREATKRKYEKQIAEVEMHALLSQMNPHFMFNSLNSINNFILDNDIDNASEYLTKFSRLMRMILDHSRSEWISLESELKALQLYIELEQVRFDHSFAFEMNISTEVNPETTLIPPMLIQPYVENAIWHGLMNRQISGGKLHLAIWRKQHQLHIQIEDNGVGREEAGRLRNHHARQHRSHGTTITEERIAIINRIYPVDARIQIHDIVLPDGEPGGTQVLLTLQNKAS